VVQWISTCSATNVNIGQVCSALLRYTEQRSWSSRALDEVHMHRLVNLTPVILGVGIKVTELELYICTRAAQSVTLLTCCSTCTGMICHVFHVTRYGCQYYRQLCFRMHLGFLRICLGLFTACAVLFFYHQRLRCRPKVEQPCFEILLQSI
jgi:hypothetical protein